VQQQLLKDGCTKEQILFWSNKGPLDWTFPFPEKDPMKVGLDWHNTLEKGGNNYIPQGIMEALEKLLAKGFKVYLLSYCFAKREQSFLQAAWSLPCFGKLAEITTCRKKTGVLGKTWLYKAWGVSHVFDDSADICKEALVKGLQVYPITTFREDHGWYDDPLQKGPFGSFRFAAAALLPAHGCKD